VRLRPTEERDLPKFVEWLGDREVTRWLAAMDSPPTLADEFEWYQGRREDPDSVMWSIETLDGRLAGNVELRMAPRAKRAEMGIAIQDKSLWSQGLGTDALRLVLRYAFDDLELNRVELTTDEENARAIRCYEKCGFVREGLLRQHRLIDGKFGNTVMMAVLREEWAAREMSKESGARSQAVGS
jgi:RimJ/RimL family protein N-acetyltransferase